MEHAAFERSGYSSALMRKVLRTDWIRKATRMPSGWLPHPIVTLR